MTKKELQAHFEQTREKAEQNGKRIADGLSQTQTTLQRARETMEEMNKEYNMIIDSLCQALSNALIKQPRDVDQRPDIRALITDCQNSAAQISIRSNMCDHLLSLNTDVVEFLQRRTEAEKKMLLDTMEKVDELETEIPQQEVEPSKGNEDAHTAGSLQSDALNRSPEFIKKMLEEEYGDPKRFSPASRDTMRDISFMATSATQMQTDGGWAIRVEFENGYGADIAKNNRTYGHDEDLWEVAVLKEGQFCYDSPITNDVIGFCTEEDLIGWCHQISELEPVRGDIELDNDDLDLDSSLGWEDR